ncbi:YceI family protein [Streptomyces sp. NBC_01497]|uniref:YceI family protein n=1 Tax=Streptomyces sp. NBC_01497 TaxID=2903885 RepID=UPI002E317200|nr:YceI family protein [Streptomyces sp. NBC_01497]
MTQAPQTPPTPQAEAVRELLADGSGAGAWALDPASSSVRITAKSIWGLVTADGTFSDVSGEGTLTADGGISGRLTIGAASIDTANAKRDTHLRSADFFDVEKHPRIVVSVSGTGGDLTGDGVALSAEITVKGATRVVPVTAAVAPEPGTGSGADSGVDAVRLSVKTVVEHREFGIVWSPMGMLKPLTAVTIEAVFRRA